MKQKIQIKYRPNKITKQRQKKCNINTKKYKTGKRNTAEIKKEIHKNTKQRHIWSWELQRPRLEMALP